MKYSYALALSEVIMNVQDIGKKAGKFLWKHSGVILTTLAAAGIIGTAVVATKQGKKIKEKEDEILEEDPDATSKEIFEETWDMYAPTAIITTGTLLCVAGLYFTDRKKQAALLSACTWTKYQLDRWREKVRERDVDTYEEIKAEMRKENQKKCRKDDKTEVTPTDINYGEKILAYDEISEEFFETSLEDLLEERYEINRHFMTHGEISVNDYRMYLGLGEVDWGWTEGWSKYIGEAYYGYSWIDIELKPCMNEYGRRYFSIHMPFGPHKDFLDEEAAEANFNNLS